MIARVLIIRPQLHGFLDAFVIGHLRSRWRLAEKLGELRSFPPPSLDVAISKGKAACLVVAVGGDVPPRHGITGYPDGVSELGVQEDVRVLVYEHEDLAGGGSADLGELTICRDGALMGLGSIRKSGYPFTD